MLKTRIKASRITNLTDARYFAAWEVKWLGFCLDPSSADYIPPVNAKAIKEWVEGPVIVGEFGRQSLSDILSTVEALGLQGVQIADTAQLQALSDQTDVPILLNLTLKDLDQLDAVAALCQEWAPLVELFILQFSSPEAFDELQDKLVAKGQLMGLCEKYRILLDLSIPPQQVEVFLEEVQAYGLNVAGGVEEKVGFKSFDELDDLFEAIEINI